MAATHADREALARNPGFDIRVTGAVLVFANTVGAEAIPNGQNAMKYQRRTALIAQVLADPDRIGAQFTRAAAGSTLANTYADTAGDDATKLAAISDAAISAYVAAAWDVIAGVQPTER